MELNHLKYFYVVAKEGGFSRASKALRVAQPSISKQVKLLENELGFELFERIGRGVRMTQRGGDLFRHCDVIFNEVEKIKTLTRRDLDPSGGPLPIGGSEAIVSHLVPEVLGALLAQHGEIVPSVVTAPASDLVLRLIRGQMELGLFLHAPELIHDLEVRREYPVPHRLIISAKKFSSKVVRARFIGSRELEDIGTRSFPTLKMLQKGNPNASIAVSTNSISAQKKLVLMGMGVAVLPLFAVKEEIEKGLVRCLHEREKLEWPIRIIARKDRIFSANAELFLSALEDRVNRPSDRRT